MKVLILTLISLVFFHNADARIIRLAKNQDKGLYKPKHNAQPGDTILLEGNYQYINLDNINGLPGKEIVITNSGRVKISGYKSYCCVVIGSHFKILGNGDPSIKNGILFSGFDSVYAGYGIALANSTNVEIAFCEFTKVQAGVMQNSPTETDMVDCYYHDLYFHDLNNPEEGGRSECFYLGNTGKEVKGKFKNCRVENNILENLSGDGIQVCQGEFIIKGNKITNWAGAQLEWQRNGILVGGFASAKVENNLLTGGKGIAFQFLGGGKNVFRNNVIKNVDVSMLQAEDIVYINAHSKNFSMDFSNNLFVNIKPNRKMIFNATSPENTSGTSFQKNHGIRKAQCILMPKDKWVD